MPLQSYTVLIVGCNCPVSILTGQRREQTLVEQLTCSVSHSVMNPRITIGIFKYLRSQFGTFLPRRLIRKEWRRHRCRVDSTALLPVTKLVLLWFPRTTAVHHLVRITLIVDLAHREEYLIFIRVVENIIVHQLTFLIEEVETESPTLQFSTDDTDVIGSSLTIALFKIRYRTLALHLNRRPFCRIVADNDKLLLFPRGVMIDEVTVHHTVAMGVSLLKHSQAGSPTIESSVWVGVIHLLRNLYLRQTIYITVCTATC